MFGRDPVTRGEMVFPFPNTREWRYQDSRHRATLIRKLASNYNKKAQEEYKRKYDEHRKAPTVYQVGEVVQCRRVIKPKGKKWSLARKWIGPFVVLKKSSSGSYLLQSRPEDRRRYGQVRRFTAPACLMRRWVERTVDPEEDSEEDDEEDVDDNSPVTTSGSNRRPGG